jgi:hypothetical protein
MAYISWHLVWLPVAGLLCGLYLIWDAIRAIGKGEFGGMLGLVKKPVNKIAEPRLFWSLVTPCLGLGLIGVAVASIALMAIISRFA